MELNRRHLLRSGAAAAGALALGPAFLRDALAAPARAGASPYGPLGSPDTNGLMLPQGFRSRLVARGLSAVEGTGYVWPIFSDGQATFRTRDGGWILVTNSESLAALGAGASAIRFAADGRIAAAYRILGSTNVNCAGGPTPWGTWLSCEEADKGLVWECDPAGVLAAEPRPALGAFKHEAAAVDPVGGRLYLTEDERGAGFYRFTPTRYPDLSTGLLEIAAVGAGGRVSWHPVPDPSTARTGTPTRGQVAATTGFQNGEGIWYAGGVLYFTTKTDKRVWAYDARSEQIEVIFDRELAKDSSLDAVDNVTVTAAGDVLVCEDGGNMEIAIITSDRTVSPLLRFAGPQHNGSEVCGAVFDPSGTRLYCTSQRAFPLIEGSAAPGAVYEISGPFRLPPHGVPGDLVFGPPAGELRRGGPLNPGGDRAQPQTRVTARRRVPRRTLLHSGLGVRLDVDEAATIAVTLDTLALARTPGRGGSTPRPRSVVLARAAARVERGGSVALRLRLARSAGRLLARRGGSVPARLLVSVRDGAGNERVLVQAVRIGPRPRRIA